MLVNTFICGCVCVCFVLRESVLVSGWLPVAVSNGVGGTDMTLGDVLSSM